jgi:uncharacterized protein (DUF2164 family)
MTTILIYYLIGLVGAVAFNYALHQPNKEIEERLEKLEKDLYKNDSP